MKLIQQKHLRSFFFLVTFWLNATVHAEPLDLPEAVTNNAVALARVNGQQMLFSFNGLSSGKTQKDIIGRAFVINLASGASKEIASLPDGLARLASTAVTLNNQIYVIGGYTVDDDNTEVSTSQIYRYFADENRYQLITHIPVAVDDSVALVYQQRYIYLVSGWHDAGNVDLVQVYDSQKDRWFNATPYPGAAIFGHAGGIVGNQFVIADGVKVNRIVDGKREYGASNENWLATINSQDPTKIHWQVLPKHPYSSFYRMASTGVAQSKLILFAGGSDNPYNYNGIGYDNIPSEPSNKVFGFDLVSSQWVTFSTLDTASMDHRGMLIGDSALYIIGGMSAGQKVLSRVTQIPFSKINSQRK